MTYTAADPLDVQLDTDVPPRPYRFPWYEAVEFWAVCVLMGIVGGSLLAVLR